MRGQPWIAAAILFSLPGLALAQDPDLAVPPMPPAPPRAITLAEAIRIADADASDLEVLRLQVERAEAAERTAWAGVLPVISGTLSYQRFDRSVERDGVTVRPADQFTAQLSVVETLSLRTISAVRMAEAASDLNRLSLEDARRIAHGAIARTFFTVIAARRASELARTQIADASRQYEAMRVRQELGAAIGLDVARTEIAALDAVRRSADADAALERAWDQLGAALGLDGPVDVAETDAPALPATEAAALERASAQRTDVRALEMSRELAGRALDDAWFRFAPTLSFSWTGTVTSATTLFNPDPTQWIFLASLTVPFYDGGVRYGALRDAQAQVAQADERLENASRGVRVQVRDSLRRAAAAERSLRIAERQVQVARRAAEAAEAAHTEGNLSGLELDAARRAAEQAELARILAELDLSTARVDVLTTTGDL
jgi:outer membrane protein TolC